MQTTRKMIWPRCFESFTQAGFRFLMRCRNPYFNNNKFSFVIKSDIAQRFIKLNLIDNLLSRKLFVENKVRKIITVIICLLLFTYSNAQEIKFKHLSTEDGLSQSVINCMLEDSYGFLWFGTQNGLNRFDGYNFKIFRHDSNNPNTLSDNNIWSIFEDDSGRIWIGTQEGILNSFDPRTEQFNKFLLDETSKVSGNSITVIYQNGSNKLWIGTYKDGLFQFDIFSGKTKHWSNATDNPNSLSNNFVTSIFEDSKKNIWIGTHSGLCLFKYNDSNKPFRRFFSDPINSNSLSHNTVWTIFQSKYDSNHIWIGTYNGLSYLDLDKTIFRRIIPDQNNHNQFSRSISSICEDVSADKKILWIGTYGGLLSYDLSANIFSRWIHQPDNPFSLTYNLINRVSIDRSGVLWIATQKGINSYSIQKDKFKSSQLKKFKDLDFSELLNSDVQAICQTGDGSVWIGSNPGLFSITLHGNKYKLSKQKFFDDLNIWSLAKGNSNDIWVGTYGRGLVHMDYRTGKVRQWTGNWSDPKNIGNSYVRAILQDRSGYLWIGLWGVGLNRLEPATGKIKRFYHKDTEPYSVSYNDVWVIFEDSKGRIWIGTFGGGLNLYDAIGNEKFYKWQHKEGIKTTLSNNNILSICETTNEKNKIAGKTILWVGTTNGLNKFSVSEGLLNSSDTKIEVDIKQYFVDAALQNINSVQEDDNGHLWITTNDGLIEFDPSAESILNTYNISDGLQSNEFNPNSSCKTSNGEIFIGSNRGLNIFDPDSIYESRYIPPVIITEFQIFNRPVTARPDAPIKTSIIEAKEIELSYFQNVFSFQFTSLDYNSPETIKYAYMMEGFDKNWIYSDSRRFATYTNLDPGNYIFKVKATNSDGLWNKKGTWLAVKINPPYWATWWFRTIIILALLSIGPFIYYRRVNALKKEKRLQVEFSKQLIQSQEEERKRIASELHDSLGQDLLVIKNLALMNKDKNEQFDEISKTTSFAIDDVRRIAYNLHPYQLDRLGLTKAISSMFTNLEGVSKIKFDNEIEIVDEIFEKEKEINIYRIIQEGVNNIIKHSGADKAKIKVQKLNEYLLIEIADNGKGFDFESVKAKSKGFGLKNLENRVSFLGGEIQFTSDSEFATIFKIKIPISAYGKN